MGVILALSFGKENLKAFQQKLNYQADEVHLDSHRLVLKSNVGFSYGKWFFYTHEILWSFEDDRLVFPQEVLVLKDDFVFKAQSGFVFLEKKEMYFDSAEFLSDSKSLLSHVTQTWSQPSPFDSSFHFQTWIQNQWNQYEKIPESLRSFLRNWIRERPFFSSDAFYAFSKVDHLEFVNERWWAQNFFLTFCESFDPSCTLFSLKSQSYEIQPDRSQILMQPKLYVGAFPLFFWPQLSFPANFQKSKWGLRPPRFDLREERIQVSFPMFFPLFPWWQMELTSSLGSQGFQGDLEASLLFTRRAFFQTHQKVDGDQGLLASQWILFAGNERNQLRSVRKQIFFKESHELEVDLSLDNVLLLSHQIHLAPYCWSLWEYWKQSESQGGGRFYYQEFLKDGSFLNFQGDWGEKVVFQGIWHQRIGSGFLLGVGGEQKLESWLHPLLSVAWEKRLLTWSGKPFGFHFWHHQEMVWASNWLYESQWEWSFSKKSKRPFSTEERVQKLFEKELTSRGLRSQRGDQALTLWLFSDDDDVLDHLTHHFYSLPQEKEWEEDVWTGSLGLGWEDSFYLFLESHWSPFGFLSGSTFFFQRENRLTQEHALSIPFLRIGASHWGERWIPFQEINWTFPQNVNWVWRFEEGQDVRTLLQVSFDHIQRCLAVKAWLGWKPEKIFFRLSFYFQNE